MSSGDRRPPHPDPLPAGERETGGGLDSTVREAEKVEQDYHTRERERPVLRGVSHRVRAKEILAVQGPSGAGKSTLLHLLGLLDDPTEGRIFFRGVDVSALSPKERSRYRNEHLGFVFQFYHLFGDMNALENVCLPRMVGLSWLRYRRERRAIEDRATDLLGRVGLGERLTHRPAQLSGGERQRVAIARALMNRPDVVICDEPTGNLDTETAKGILDLLWDLNKELGETFVIATHDEELAVRAHRRVYMVDGQIVAG